MQSHVTCINITGYFMHTTTTLPPCISKLLAIWRMLLDCIHILVIVLKSKFISQSVSYIIYKIQIQNLYAKQRLEEKVLYFKNGFCMQECKSAL